MDGVGGCGGGDFGKCHGAGDKRCGGRGFGVAQAVLGREGARGGRDVGERQQGEELVDEPAERLGAFDECRLGGRQGVVLQLGRGLVGRGGGAERERQGTSDGGRGLDGAGDLAGGGAAFLAGGLPGELGGEGAPFVGVVAVDRDGGARAALGLARGRDLARVEPGHLGPAG